ncbi:hypothetical protein pb186bvf_007545 [Paramecium bursaria]
MDQSFSKSKAPSQYIPSALDMTCSFKFATKQQIRGAVIERIENYLSLINQINSKLQFGKIIGKQDQRESQLQILREEQSAIFKYFNNNEGKIDYKIIIEEQLSRLLKILKDISVQVPIDEQIIELLIYHQQQDSKQRIQSYYNYFSDYLQEEDNFDKILVTFKEIHHRFIFQEFIETLDLIKSMNIIQYQIQVIDEIDFEQNNEQDFRLLIKLFPQYEKQLNQMLNSIINKEKYERNQDIQFNQLMQIIYDKHSRKYYEQFASYGDTDEKTILVLTQLLKSQMNLSVIAYIQQQIKDKKVLEQCIEVCSLLISTQPLQTIQLIIKQLNNPLENLDKAYIYYYLQEDQKVCEIIQQICQTKRSTFQQGPLQESIVKVEQSIIISKQSFIIDTKLMLLVQDLRKILIQAHIAQQYFNYQEKCPEQFKEKFQQLTDTQFQKLITRVNQSNIYFSKTIDDKIQGQFDQFSQSYEKYVDLLTLKGPVKSVLQHYYQYNFKQKSQLYKSNEKILDYDQYKYELEVSILPKEDQSIIIENPTKVYDLDKKQYEDGVNKAKEEYTHTVFQCLKDQFKKDYKNSELTTIFIEILKTLQKKEVNAKDMTAIRQNWRNEFNNYFKFQGFDSIEQLQGIKSMFQ